MAGDGAGVDVFGELHLEFDKQVAWLVMLLKWHTLAVYDLEFRLGE